MIGAGPLTVLLALGAAPPPGLVAEPVDPHVLVVPQPDVPDERTSGGALSKLLEARLSIIDHAQRLDIDIARRTRELDRLAVQRNAVETDLARASSRFEQLSAELKEARRLIRRRLGAMVQLRRTAPYQLLFSAEDYSTFLRRQHALGTLLEADKVRVRGYRLKLDRWRVARDDLERRRRNLRNTEDRITYALRELNWDREEKAALLEAVRTKQYFLNKVGRELEDVDAELSKQLQDLSGRFTVGRFWFSSFKGRHPMAIRKGEIIGRYGVRRHKGFKTTTRHYGVDLIPSDWNKKSDVEVIAIYPGYIAYADWLRGLGNTVIIDHTDGYMTLYGHLRQISDGIVPGKKVAKKDVLGLMGDTGSLFGTRLYFEIRKDGKAINPTPWFQ